MSTARAPRILLAAILASVAAPVLPAAGADPGYPQTLRCEYLENPSGIDVRRPRLNWMLDEASPIRAQAAYRILVASRREMLGEDQGDVWDSGRVASSQSTWVQYAGRTLKSGERVYWKVRAWSQAGQASRWSAVASWSMGLLEPDDWHAQFIGEARPAGVAEGTPLPSPWLRKTFALARKPARAVAYVNVLGYYELYVNGRKVDDQVLGPAVSDYSHRNLYVAHEVGDYLVAGRNVVALWLGRGWYVRRHPGVVHDGPLVRAQVEVTAPDGGTTEIVTDGSWKLRESPITPIGRGTAFGDYGGERYDARLDLQGWNEVGLDDSSWQAAAVFTPPAAATTAQMVEPNRLVDAFPARRVDAHPMGGWVIDLGMAFTGWLKIHLPPIPAGTVVTLEYSDQAAPDLPAPGSAPPPAGSPGGSQPPAFRNTFNQRDEVVGSGRAVTFCSRFNYHGFRYVRVTGLDKPPALGDAVGILIRTAYQRAGHFSSSDLLLDQIYELTTRTYESLTLGGYVVDCPTRERLGYGGDAGTSLETGLFNFSTGGLYSRWLANWRDAQEPTTGSLPHTAPNYPNQGGGGPMWGGFVVTLPWQLYVQYGDRGVLETNYPMIGKWLAYLASEAKGGLLLDHTSHAMAMQQWNFLGDWLTPKGSLRGAVPPVQLINSTHYLYQLQLASKIARVLGKTADAAGFDRRAAEVSRAIHGRFYNPADHTYTNGDSVQEAFPLLTGVVPPSLRPAVAHRLAQVIVERNGGRLDTGMHGTYFVTKYLMETGRNDLVYGMTRTREYPGWGYMLANGATTSWEGWTGQSHIHDTLISIGAWFIEGIGGIRADERAPGYRHFFVSPAPVGDLTFATASYQSLLGRIVSDWRVEGGTLTLRVTVPPGATATVVVPGTGPVRTAAPRAAASPGGTARAYLVGPGTHTFVTAR
jgi:alpha-L-rhamnosidase